MTTEVGTTETGALRIPEAARYLGIGVSKFYMLVRAKEIGVLKIGSRSIVARSELDDYLRRLAEASATQA